MQGLSERIDRNSFEPAYAQLANLLRTRIAQGEFVGDKPLPSEAQLIQQYQVSSMTVRRAIKTLLDQGVVSTTRGRGTFVKPMQMQTITFSLEEFTRLFEAEQDTSVKILQARVVRAEGELCARLALKPGQRAIHIASLIRHHQTPVVYHWEYLIYDPRKPIVEAEIEVTSLRGLFTGGQGALLKMGEMTLEATIVDEAKARLLEMEPGSAALHLTHTFYDYQDQPVSWGGFICRGDKLRLSTRLGATPEPGANGILRTAE